MSNEILLKRSAVAGAVPPALNAGELALNRADGELYYLDASNQIVSLLEIDCGEITEPPPAPASGLSMWRAESLDSNWHWSN
jgi:hypothetical protein